MREPKDPPHENGEQDKDETDHTPSQLERTKMMLEIVWIIARLLGM